MNSYKTNIVNMIKDLTDEGKCSMAKIHYEDGEPSYVLESDISEEERAYVGAMNFLGACPVPKGMKPGDHAFYVSDYLRWYQWRMAQGEDWKERAKHEWWYEHVEK